MQSRMGDVVRDSPMMSAQRAQISRTFGAGVPRPSGMAAEAAAQGARSLGLLAASGPNAKLTALQAYKKSGAKDGGNFIGESAACHCHIDIGKPHFKVGKDDGTRINFGRDMSLERMQRAYEALLSQHAGKAGFDDCKEYMEEQGCTAPEAADKVQALKDMLMKWGGLSADKIHYYSDEGLLMEIPIHGADQLDDSILGAESEIRHYDSVYSDWQDEQVAADEVGPDKNYHAGKKAIKAHQGAL
jgi:hypothetical protein